mmetsp:Transcript_6358/g.25652  ORF Transcript_6358/g.25652 Transcript_6358/m.25652 type:complete len:518 (+) Transcript_6358:30-1583(+)
MSSARVARCRPPRRVAARGGHFRQAAGLGAQCTCWGPRRHTDRAFGGRTEGGRQRGAAQCECAHAHTWLCAHAHILCACAHAHMLLCASACTPDAHAHAHETHRLHLLSGARDGGRRARRRTRQARGRGGLGGLEGVGLVAHARHALHVRARALSALPPAALGHLAPAQLREELRLRKVRQRGRLGGGAVVSGEGAGAVAACDSDAVLSATRGGGEVRVRARARAAQRRIGVCIGGGIGGLASIRMHAVGESAADIAVGAHAIAVGVHTIAVGVHAVAVGVRDVAVGVRTVAVGTRAVAVAVGAHAVAAHVVLSTLGCLQRPLATGTKSRLVQRVRRLGARGLLSRAGIEVGADGRQDVLNERVHDGRHGTKDARVHAWKDGLLLLEELLDAVALLGLLEARGAVVGDDGQPRGVRKVAQRPLANVHEGADDVDVAGVDRVRRLHDPELAVVKGAHEKRLGLVVEMLRERQLVVAMLAAARVERAAFHARAERADAVPLHVAIGRPLHYGILEVVVR